MRKLIFIASAFISAPSFAVCISPGFTGNQVADQRAQQAFYACLQNEQYQQQQLQIQQQQLQVQQQQLQTMQRNQPNYQILQPIQPIQPIQAMRPY